jgi:ATP-dependent helicase/nuclease subunit B
MGTRIETTSYGVAAVRCLRGVVADYKQDDPMRPVTILLPNNTAGLVARRFLAAGFGADRAGIAGLHLETLPRLAEQLAAPTLAPRRPATGPIVAASWRTALAREPGVFAEVAEHPATIQALASAHRELRDLSDSALDAVGASSALSADLVRLHRTVTTALAVDWYDPTHLLVAAAARIRSHPDIAAELGALVLYLPQELTRAEAGLVEALAGSAELTVVVGLTDVQRADRTVRRSTDRLGLSLPDRTEPRRPIASRVLNASDADDEVRCAVRELMSALRRTPAHRIAILYAAASPYARLVHEHLAAAGIEANGPGTRPVHERAIGRTLLELLALVDHDVPRADLFRVLAGAPTRDFAGERIPVTQWERMSRLAGVVRGDDWRQRLTRYAEAERKTVAQEEQAEDPRPGVIDRATRSAERAERLRDFAVELRRRLSAAAGLTTWADLSAAVAELYDAVFPEPEGLPVEEQYAAVAVQMTLRGLGTLDELGTPASLPVLRDVLDLELQRALPRVGSFGTGVLVAPLEASVGLSADVVYVIGLAEDLYPGRLHEDALLPERARQVAHGELALSRDELDAKHRHLLAAFAAGAEVVASFPRGDLRRSSHRLPSRWLLPTLRDLSQDKRLAATHWDEPDYGTAMHTSASYAGSLTTADPATEQDWRVRRVAVGAVLADPVVDRAVSLLKARASDAFTRYDGNLAGADGLPDYARQDRTISPTALESYASCPHAFFVERLLRVEPVEQPEDILVISPLEIGNLVHESMDAFVSEQGEDLPAGGAPWTTEQRARLIEITRAKADEFEAEGLTGHPRLWQRERMRILADLAWLLTDDDRWRAERKATVVATELRFGFDGQAPVEVRVASGRVLLRGSADKIDVGGDGTIYVTDLKTGSASRFEGIDADPVVAGTKLQLPVYAYAARAVLGDDSLPVEASYWFVRKDRGKRIPVHLTPQVEQRYADTLDVIVSSIAAGLFPAKAPEIADFAWVQCPYCNPDGIGHSDARARWDRKRHAPDLARLVGLVEPSVLDDPSLLDDPPATSGIGRGRR